jgi:tetratricopeptide (TPR) repeat protein
MTQWHRFLLPLNALLAIILAAGAPQTTANNTANAASSSATHRSTNEVEPVQSGVITHHPTPQRNVLPPPELDLITSPPNTPPPDHSAAPPKSKHSPTKTKVAEQTLWDLLGQQRYAELRRNITNLRTRYPDWQPPSRLLALLSAGETTQAIEHAVANRNNDALIDLAWRYPEHFDCDHVHALWALADAWQAHGQSRLSAAVHKRIIAECPRHPDRRISLQKLQRYLSPADTAALLDREVATAKPVEEMPLYADLRYRFYLGWLARALETSNHAHSLSILASIENDIDTRQDADAATMAGWTYLNQTQHTPAATWFAKARQWQLSEDATYGLALSHFRNNDLAGTETIIRQYGTPSERLRSLLADVLVARALVNMNEKHYAAALTSLDKAARHRPLTSDQQRMRAWSLYQTENYTAAQTTFDALYRQQPDQNSAAGLYFSHAQQEDWDQLEAIVDATGGPVTALWQAHLAERNYYRKQFLSAAALVPGKYPKLDNIASPSVHIGTLLRHRSGDKGLSRLTLSKLPVAEGVYVHDDVHRFALRLDRVGLDSGVLPDNAVIGRFPTTPQSYAFEPTTRINAGIEPQLSYRRDGWLMPYFNIGMTPSDGMVSSRLIWNLGLASQTDEGYWDLSLSARPVRDSILSYVGMVDPYGGQQWGRVLKTGVNLTLQQNMTQDWRFQGAVNIARLKGHNVANNDHLALRLGLGKTLTLKRFDYISFGPILELQRYDRNLSYFTFGHGGYFSPQQLIRLAAALSALSTEGRSFILDAEGSIGYQRHREDSSPLFPLSPDKASNHASTRRSGVVLNLEAKGVWLLNSHWQLGGGFGVRTSPRYDDVYGNLFIRMTFKSRQAMFSYDIPEFAFETLF